MNNSIMAKVSEKIHLLLVINNGKQPNSGGQACCRQNCFLLSCIQLLFLMLFLAVLIFFALKVIEIQKNIKQKDKMDFKDVIPGSDFCKSINTENMSLVTLGYLTGVKEEELEVKNKVYYITDRLFTDQEACVIEAHLRILQEKSLFVVEIGNLTSTGHSKIDYVNFLQEQYTNLNRIKSTTDTFFKGSPFQNYFRNVSDFSLFAAKVLLVWQFGGTVLSPNLILLNRRIFDNNEGYCEVDSELLFCPNQCSAYVYQLVKTVLDILKSPKKSQALDQASLKHIIDQSVQDYCGDKFAVAVGCDGINRIKAYSVCQTLSKDWSEDCAFLQMQQWKLKDDRWKKVVQKFCPNIATKYFPSSS